MSSGAELLRETGFNMEQDSDWRFCVVGNIVRTHKGDNGETYYGTKEFTGGTKVYINGRYWYDFERTDISVIGLNRFKRYVFAWIDPNMIENVRLQVIKKPTVLRIMDYEEAMEGWEFWGRTAQDRRDAKVFAENWPDLLKTVNMRKGDDRLFI